MQGLHSDPANSQRSSAGSLQSGPVLAWSQVGFEYEAGEPALSDFNLAVPFGGRVAVIGPSGCGKSTLLKLALGLLWPRHGDVVFNNDRLTPQNVLSIRQQIGYVIQSGGLFPHLSARANVGLMARYLKHSDRAIRTRIDELASMVRLPSSVLERTPDMLSGGQRQRVSLMRALMLDPPVLLLDEPLGALDPMVRFELQDELHALFERLDKSVVLVTHDLAEAAFLARDVVLMRAGRIEQQGSIEQLTHEPHNEFVKNFVRAQRSIHA